MAHVFEPRGVPPERYVRWLLSAYELIKRRPALFIGVSGFYIALASLRWFGVGFWALSAMSAISLCIGLVVSRAADESISVSELWSEITAHQFTRIVTSGIFLYAVLFVALSALLVVVIALLIMVAGFYGDGSGQSVGTPLSPPVVPEITNLSEKIGNFIVGPVGVLIMFTGWLAWFYLPLVAIARIGHLGALRLAWRALMLNLNVLPFFVMTSVLLLFLIAVAPLLLIPYMPMFCALMYVSYRDIWLLKSENMPMMLSKRSAVVIPT